MRKKLIWLLCVAIVLANFHIFNTTTLASQIPVTHRLTLNLDPCTTFQTMEGFGFFGARAVWWNRMPFNPTRYLPLYAGGEPISDMDWIDFILLDLGITMWRNEIYPFLPVYSLSATNPQDSHWAEQKYFVKALNDRAVELGIDLRVILTVWSPPGEWKYNQHTRAHVASQSPPPPPEGMSMQQWNRLMPEHYIDFAYWLVSALEMYREIGVEVYAISPQNEPYFNQSFNSSFYNAAEFVEMLNIVAPIIYNYFPNVYVFGAEAMLGHEHSSIVADWTNTNMHFHRRILERATPEAMRNFVFAHHGYYDGVYAQALEGHAALWAAERHTLGTRGNNRDPNHRLWMTETSGYSNQWLDDDPNRPGSLALGMAIQSALIYGDVSAWVWWQGSDTTGSAAGGYYELMRPGLNRNKIAVSQHFYRYIRPGAVRIGANLSQESRYLMTSAFVHDGLDNMVIVIVNNGVDYYDLNIQGAISGITFQSVITIGSPYYLLPGPNIAANGGRITVPPHSIVTLVHGSYTEHGTLHAPALTPAEMARRDVYLAKNALQSVSARGTTFVTNSRLGNDKDGALRVAGRLVGQWAFYLDWEIIDTSAVFVPAENARPGQQGKNGYLHFQVRVSQDEFYGTTETLILRIAYVELDVPETATPDVEAPTDTAYDAADDTTTEDTTPPTDVPTQATNSGSGTSVVVIAVVAGVLIATASGIIFFVKPKRKNTNRRE